MFRVKNAQNTRFTFQQSSIYIRQFTTLCMAARVNSESLTADFEIRNGAFYSTAALTWSARRCQLERQPTGSSWHTENLVFQF